MSGDTAIRVERLGKRYRITHRAQLQQYTTMRDAIAQRLVTPIRAFFGNRVRARATENDHPGDRGADLHGASRESTEDFWALRDVSFDVRQGDVIGIIGRNGAGKSTLLKILSRITDPSEGRVTLRGRVASLLEVGTGFHPELTGRENIFLNGAILGMTRAELRTKFDEIVAFAEVEQFLDTPVKRYSSGMYVRLAFAVAAHLEPEILVVDEVLAVGDADFQKKCLGKMGEVARGGRTVLFVSHNMSAIGHLCTRCVLLADGRLVADGDIGSVIGKYMHVGAHLDQTHVSLVDYRDRSGDGRARIVEASLRSQDGQLTRRFSVGDTIVVEYRVEYLTASDNFSHSIELTNSDGVPVYHLWDIDSRCARPSQVSSRVVRAKIHNVNLCPDTYYMTLWVGDCQGGRADRVADCLSFTIDDATSTAKRRLHKSKGLIYKEAEWDYLQPR